MTDTERKRAWRLRNPERSQEAERRRAKARRDGFWDPMRKLGDPAPSRPCASNKSYYRYEWSVRRMLQKMNWRRIGPGSMRMSREERQAAYKTYFDDRCRALGLDPELARVDPIAALRAT